MNRQNLIEQISRLVHNGQPTQDSQITDNLINIYINQGLALAVKQNYKEAIQLDGVGYVNNSFYTTFKSIAITQDENFLWKFELPQIPTAVGKNEGISNIRFKSTLNKVSIDAIPLSTNQTGYVNGMRRVPNKVLYYVEGNYAKVLTPILMSEYTASVTMISGGNSSDLTSELIVPDDYIPVIIDYCSKLLILERNQAEDSANDGSGAIKTT
jgi:hypothetical protein